MKPEANIRNTFIDSLKGWLIILVVMGHAIQFIGSSTTAAWEDSAFWKDPIYQFIYMFHMPLFMAVSGYLSLGTIRNRPLMAVIKRRFWQLIIPALSWSLLYKSAMLVLPHTAGYEAAPFYEEYFREVCVSYWFLLSAFGSTCIVALLRYFKQDNALAFGIVFLLSLLLPEYGVMHLFKYTFPFFLLGYWAAAGKKLDGVTLTPIRSLAILAASVVCFVLWKPDTYIYVTGMGLDKANLWNVTFRYVAGVVMSLLFLGLVWLSPPYWHPPIVTKFGRRSLDIYIIQTYFFIVASRVPHLLKDKIYFSALIAPALAFLVCYICCRLGEMLDRIPWLARFMLGRIPAKGKSHV